MINIKNTLVLYITDETHVYDHQKLVLRVSVEEFANLTNELNRGIENGRFTVEGKDVFVTDTIAYDVNDHCSIEYYDELMKIEARKGM